MAVYKVKPSDNDGNEYMFASSTEVIVDENSNPIADRIALIKKPVLIENFDNFDPAGIGLDVGGMAPVYTGAYIQGPDGSTTTETWSGHVQRLHDDAYTLTVTSSGAYDNARAEVWTRGYKAGRWYDWADLSASQGIQRLLPGQEIYSGFDPDTDIDWDSIEIGCAVVLSIGYGGISPWGGSSPAIGNIYRTLPGHYTMMMMGNSPGQLGFRWCNNGVWSDWVHPFNSLVHTAGGAPLTIDAAASFVDSEVEENRVETKTMMQSGVVEFEINADATEQSLVIFDKEYVESPRIQLTLEGSGRCELSMTDVTQESFVCKCYSEESKSVKVHWLAIAATYV